MSGGSRPWKDFLLRHKRVKILSLGLAVISWYAIRDATSFEVVMRDVRLEIQVPDGMAIQNQSATSVDVTFRGSQEDTRLIDPARLRAVVDLRAASAGSTELQIGPRIVEGVRGVRAVDVKPNRLRVSLDRESEKLMSVKGMWTGKPLLGQVESVTCDPPIVRVRGPARKLDATEMVYTSPVDVDGRIESFAKRSPVLPPSDTWGVRIEPPEVQLKIRIVQKSAEREWDNVPVMAMVPPGLSVNAVFRPSQVSVMASGRSEVLAAISDEQVKAVANCSGLAVPGEYEVPVSVSLPTEAGVTAVTDPETIKVILRKP